MRKLWTTEEDEILINARDAGLQYKDIVPLLPDRNLRTISVRGATLCPSRSVRYWSAQEDEDLITLRREGESYEQCAIILGRSYTACKTRGSLLLKSGRLREHTDLQRTEDPNAISGVEWAKRQKQ